MSRLPALWFVLVVAAGAFTAPAQEPDQGDYSFLVQDGQRKLQKGELSSAEAAFVEVLDAFKEEPVGSRPSEALVEAARLGLFSIDLRRGDYEKVRDGLAQLPEQVRLRRPAVLLRAQALIRLGAYVEAASLLEILVAQNADDVQARHELGEVLARDGQRRRARELWQQNVAGKRPDDALQLAYLGRSHWRLGGRANIEAAAKALVDSLTPDLTPDLAPDLAPDRNGAGTNHDGAEARTTLGILNFEAYGETAGFESGEKQLKKVLELNPEDEEALLA
ncbi:MAG: hypothetical protein ABIP94_24920, partial [Planctomycetota bacterium]